MHINNVKEKSIQPKEQVAQEEVNAMLEVVKNQLDINKPAEFWAKLRALEEEVYAMDKEFRKVWSYCCGCNCHVRLNEAYADTAENGEPILRCSKCHSVVKHLR